LHNHKGLGSLNGIIGMLEEAVRKLYYVGFRQV